MDVDQPRMPMSPVVAERAPVSSDAPLALPPRVNCQDLMQGHRELEIEHGGAIYRLRITAMGRLILTK